MWDGIHQFLYDTRYLWLLVGIGGIAYASILIFKVIGALSKGSKRKLPSRSFQLNREAASSQGGDEHDDIETVMSPAPGDTDVGVTEDEPFQEDLLSQLPDDSFAGQTAEAAQAKEAKVKVKEAPSDEVDAPSPAVYTRDTDPEQRTRTPMPNYGIDQKARTRMDLRPDQIPGVAPTAPLEEPVTTSESNLEKEQTPTESMPAQERGPVDDKELLRRATRMEELGFHIGITPEKLRSDPTAVTEEEKTALMETIGLMEQMAESQKERVPAGELDDILARLDQALEESFTDDPNDQSSIETEATPRPPSQADSRPQTQDMDTEPLTRSEPTDAFFNDPKGPRTDQFRAADANKATESIVHKEKTPEPPTEQMHNAPTQRIQDSASAIDPSISKAIQSALTPQKSEAAADEEDAEKPQDAKSPAEPAPTQPKSEKKATDKTRAKSKKSPKAIPDWARADTFDEDLDESDDDKSGGSQLNLFG